jgi:hemerythrin-like metal-binding protein
MQNDRKLLQGILQRGIDYFYMIDSHLRYGTDNDKFVSNDRLIDDLSTSRLEGLYPDLDSIMFHQTSCLMLDASLCNSTTPALGVGLQRNFLLTESYTGLDALFQIFIADILHMSELDGNLITQGNAHFLRLLSLANNDLYDGSLQYSAALHDQSHVFISDALKIITNYFIASVVTYFFVFFVLLAPLRSFFNSVVNHTNLLNDLIPEIQREDLQWRDVYISEYQPYNVQNRRLLSLLATLVEVAEEKEDSQASQNTIRTTAENIIAIMGRHFDREEEWMAKYIYPLEEDHIHEHTYLMKEAAYLLRYLLHMPESTIVVSNVLQMFFISHLQTSDLPLGKWIVEYEENVKHGNIDEDGNILINENENEGEMDDGDMM